MTHLVTTLTVLTQNFIPLKRFSSMINVINLVINFIFSHIQSRKLGSFDMFLHEMNEF